MLATPIEVKKAYKEGTHKKKYRFVVLKDDGTEDFTIDNDTLVAESVHIDERMATGSELKFGLCEGSSLEFQYFDHPNINGRQVQAFIDIYYDDVHTHSTPMGYFTVKECPRQFSTGIYKATAYNKIQSDYLDANANVQISQMQSDGTDPDKISLQTIQDELLSGYEISPAEENIPVGGEYSGITIRQGDLNINIRGTSYPFYVEYQQFDYELDMNKRTKIQYPAWYLDILRNAVSEANYAVGIDHLASTPSCYHFGVMVGFESDFLLNAIYSISEYISENAPISARARGLVEKLYFLNGIGRLDLYMPISIGGMNGNTKIPVWSTDERLTADDIIISQMATDSIQSMAISRTNIPDVTLRELIAANYELRCLYGQMDRVTNLFYGAELNGGGLYPAETLYPADGLYPNSNTGGQGIHPYPSEYSQLWTDTMGEQSFRYLIITYKTLDENNNEVDAVLQRTVNADGTTDYNMSDNWLFRNLVWTAADVGDYADAMVLKMQNIRWLPFEMWAAGLPYVETGDAIEITDREGNTHNSYILQRQLQGIQNLQDTYVNGELDIF